MERYENVETADEYISILSWKDSLKMIEDVLDGGKLSSKDETQWSNLKRHYEDLGFVERRPYLQNPKRSVYEPTGRLEEFYDTVRSYREEIEGFDDVIESFTRKTAEWTGFLASFEEGDTASDLYPVIDETNLDRYMVQGEKLSLFHTREHSESEQEVIDEKTEKGRKVQEFVREVGDSLPHPDTAQASEEEEKPVWKR